MGKRRRNRPFVAVRFRLRTRISVSGYRLLTPFFADIGSGRQNSNT
jgi:hypothetical protein